MNRIKKITFSGAMFYVVNIIYMVNVFGILFSVLVNSIGVQWPNGAWLQAEFGLKWWEYCASHHDLKQLLFMTMLVTVIAVLLSVVLAYPAAFIMAKRKFAGKKLVHGLFLLPVIIPPICYGLPLATVFYKVNLATTLAGVVIANMVPTVSYMILVILPFIEQVGDNVESASRMLGASRLQYFTRILIPLTFPGLMSAIMLSIVRVISMFELTFLVSGAKTQTLVVALFADVNAPGYRPIQMIDALAMIFFIVTVILFVISMKFGSPTSVYSQIGSEK